MSEHKRTGLDLVPEHQSDCVGSLCPTCGCCIHCVDDCGCDGCDHPTCLCNPQNELAPS